MGAKIILADESITIQKVVQIIYRNSDIQIIIVANFDELLQTSKDIHPDVVLLSSVFSGLNLEEGIKQIFHLREKPGLPVIILADRAEGWDSETCKSYGAAGFLYKPLDNRQLKKTVEQVITEAKPETEEMETQVQPVMALDIPIVTPSVSTEEQMIPAITPVTSGKGTQQASSPEQRSRVLMEVFESYLNENVILLTDSIAKNLAPKIAPEVAGKIIESIDFSDLSYKIAAIVEGVIRDLVPQLAEELISREIDKIKQEASQIVLQEDQEQID